MAEPGDVEGAIDWGDPEYLNDVEWGVDVYEYDGKEWVIVLRSGANAEE